MVAIKVVFISLTVMFLIKSGDKDFTEYSVMLHRKSEGHSVHFRRFERRKFQICYNFTY